MENLEKEKTTLVWEIGVLEAVADGDELQLLEMAQDCVTRLAAELCQMKSLIWADGKVTDYEREVLRLRMSRVLVMLDALQLRYGDCSEEELNFLEGLAELLEKE